MRSRGDVEKVEVLVGEVRDGQARQQLILLAGAFVAIIVVAALAARLVLRRRQGRAPAASHSLSGIVRPAQSATIAGASKSPDSPLLAQLLATPTEDTQP